MTNIARKSRLAENLALMKKRFKKDYSFFPATYILPREKMALRQQYFDPSGKSRHTFIVKPDGGCQGKGIFLTKSFSALEDLSSTHVAQKYIVNPLLIEGKKFDLRIYVLITSCDPLRVYLFRDGLVRLCTEDFVSPNAGNMDDRCMHLTNYSINKRNDNFDGDHIDVEGSSGSKRSIKWLLSWLADEKGQDVVDAMWNEVGQICVKTIISILPVLVREYKTTFGLNENTHPRIPVPEDIGKGAKKVVGSRCFAILGVDIMIDSKLKPHLIEVNHLPSFATDSPLDGAIKSKVVYQALSTVKASSADKRTHEMNEKAKRKGRILKRHQGHTISVEEGNNTTREGIKSTGSSEKDIIKLYERFAPDKLDRIPALLKKYEGYEHRLLQKVIEKYEKENCYNEVVNDKEKAPDLEWESKAKELCIEECEEGDVSSEGDPYLLEEEMTLVDEGDYDRIYPPVVEGLNKLPPYDEMKVYANEEEVKQQMRLTCPLWQLRELDESEEGTTEITSKMAYNKEHNSKVKAEISSGNFGRGDWLVHGNIHIRKKETVVPKVIQPPTQKQIDAADRLSRGFSAEENTNSCENCIGTNSSNTFIERLSQAEREGKEIRRRNEEKFVPRSELSLNPINIQFAHKLSKNNNNSGFSEKCYVDFAGRKLGYS